MGKYWGIHSNMQEQKAPNLDHLNITGSMMLIVMVLKLWSNAIIDSEAMIAVPMRPFTSFVNEPPPQQMELKTEIIDHLYQCCDQNIIIKHFKKIIIMLDHEFIIITNLVSFPEIIIISIYAKK